MIADGGDRGGDGDRGEAAAALEGGVAAFRGCSGLTVTVASVTLDLIGMDAFSGCTVLTSAASSHVEALL